MQPIEIRIPGEFWDSFIYNRHLYLVTFDGYIKTYNWEQIVQSVTMAADYQPLFWQYLTRGQEWYSPQLQRILESPQIRQTIESLTKKISAQFYEIPPKSMEAALIDTSRSPSHPHTDIEGFYNVLYLSSLDGIYAAPFRRKLGQKFQRMSDVPALRVACSWGSMAVAAGSEGMFDRQLFDFRSWPNEALGNIEPRQLSDRYCASCSWASFDVVGSSGPRDAGFIAAFSKPEADDEESRPSLTATSRDVLDVIDSDTLFPSSDGLLFGAQGVLVMASQNKLQVEGYNPRLRDEKAQVVDFQQALFNERSLKFSELTGDAIGGAATIYGILVEMDSALLLRGVDGSISAFGQPVNWRTFPRSHHYLNQLHLTYDDYVSILAFTDDYFPAGDRGPAAYRPMSRPGRV
jgi:hypothetical protein